MSVDSISGKQVEKVRGTVRVNPYNERTQMRTHTGMECKAIEAVEKDVTKQGVKGPSLLSSLGHFDLVNSFVPDYLHCALLGVAWHLASLWFTSKHHNESWYTGQSIKRLQYESNLKGIVVPKEIRRLPRSIATRDHGNGKEFKTFVLYYALILLDEFMPREFLNHRFLFGWSMHKLQSDSIC